MRIIVLIALTLVSVMSHSQQLDLLIRGARIIDGTGNGWFYGDIGISNGKITFVGNATGMSARQEIDATGLIAAPGFIDVHTHIERNDMEVPTADNFIFDGVTTVITGNCGSSETDLRKYYAQLDSLKLSVNVASLIGHNSVRRQVMGDQQRDPTAEEQSQMELLVSEAMRCGSVGLSTGLIYVPGTYSKTQEVVGLARVAAHYGGVYSSHIRDEGDHVIEAIDEAIQIGKVANMPVQISHFKVTYKPNWGRSAATLAKVIEARDAGIDVTIDQYPYVASSTSLNTVLPAWAFSGGNDSLKIRLNLADVRSKIKSEMLTGLKAKKLKNFSYAVVAKYDADSAYNGMNISEINKLKGRRAKPSDEAETILEMVENGSAQMVFFSMNESDLRRIMTFPFNMIASDAGFAKAGDGMPHPRTYGTNARVLGRYVREYRVLGLEDAIRRMTSLPASKFNLEDRGLVKTGFAADLVIFDFQTVIDNSTFSKPHAFSSGFKYVIVNGAVTMERGKHTLARNGVVLRRAGWNNLRGATSLE